MKVKLNKKHSSSPKDNPPLCIYCETFHPARDRFPKRHTENIAGDPVKCTGALHRELNLHEAVPGVSGPEVMVIVACDTCTESKSWKFFEYVHDAKTFELMTPQELVGVVFGHLHVMNSDAMLLVHFAGDKNLKPKAQGKKIAIHRAIAHAAMQALSDVVHSERLGKLVDLTYTIGDDGCSVFLGTIKVGTLSPTRVKEIERLVRTIDAARPLRLSGEGTETLLHEPLGIRPCPPARPLAAWRENDGPALWWRFPIEEPPFAGTPLDSDWPGYHTHWTPIPIPSSTEDALDSADLSESSHIDIRDIVES